MIDVLKNYFLLFPFFSFSFHFLRQRGRRGQSPPLLPCAPEGGGADEEAEVVENVAEVETIATESAADEAGAEAKAEGDAAAVAAE